MEYVEPSKEMVYILSECKACYHDHSKELSYFPVKARTFLKKAHSNPFYATKHLNLKQPKGKALNDLTSELCNNLNTYYKQTTGHSFAEAVSKPHDTGIQQRESLVERKKNQRNMCRNWKEHVEINGLKIQWKGN